MAEIGKYSFQIINVIALRYIELKCAFAINVYLSSLESEQNYLKANFFMKPWLAIQKITRACLQNEPIIGSLTHSIKFFHKKYTVRQRKYCDKLSENFKSVFICNISNQHGLAYFISTCCSNGLHFL